MNGVEKEVEVCERGNKIGVKERLWELGVGCVGREGEVG